MVTPAVATPKPPKVKLRVIVQSSSGVPIPAAEVEILNFRRELPGSGISAKRQTPASGIADFGDVDPRINFTIHARKTGFGPPAKPFAIGDAVVSALPPAGGTPIPVVLTQNQARLTVQVLNATLNVPLPAANVGVDGITGTPQPLTPITGLVGPFVVPADVPIRTHAQHAGFGPLLGGLPFGGEVVAVVTLADGQDFTQVLRLLAAPTVTPRIDQAKILVVAKKSYTNPTRQRIILSADTEFGGTGHLTLAGAGAVKFFSAATGGVEIPLGRSFSDIDLRAGFPLFIEGVTATGKMDGLTLTLTLSGGNKAILGPAKTTITVVAVTLDICQSRRQVGVDPAPLSQADKIGAGRFIHLQTNPELHGRARLNVGLAPHDFTGTLVLTRITAGLALFAADVDPNGAAQVALPSPHNFPAASVGNQLAFFAEGNQLSAALHDTGYRIGIQGLDPDCDHVLATVMQFSNLVATVPTTPAQTTRMGNVTTPDTSTHTIGAGTPSFFDYSEDFGVNRPLVLIEGSLPASKTVVLSVDVAPAGVPVRWSVQRDTRPAPNGDNPAILTLSPAPAAAPTITPFPFNPVKADLLANSVGAFNICPYVDCNGSGVQDFNDPTSGARIDREPYILMGLVLVRVQGFRNTSRAQPANIRVRPNAPTAATGVSFSSGRFNGGPARAGVHNDAVVTLIGGGRRGRTGLDQVFGGWANNVTGMNAVSSYVQAATATTPAATHNMTSMMAINAVAGLTPSGGNATTPGNVVTQFIPATNTPTPQAVPPAPATRPQLNVAPVVATLPILDVSPFADAGTGGNSIIGTEGVTASRPSIAVARTRLPAAGHNLAIGEDWRVQMFDSPGFGDGPTHPVFPGTLASVSFNVDFSCDLCFWTNLLGSPAAPGAGNEVASRLYVSVQSNIWHVNFDISFNATTGAGTVGTRNVSLTRDPAITRAAVVVGAGGATVETRFPTGLGLWSQDART